MTRDDAADAGGHEVCTDVVTQTALDRLTAVLDDGAVAFPPNAIPPLAHWLFTRSAAAQAALGPDGHAAAGLIVPPPARPRRMWGGSRIAFPGTLHVGDAVERRSTVTSVDDKAEMTLVVVRHEIATARGVAVVEEQDLVYLPARTGPDAAPVKPLAVPEPLAVRTMTADTARLFRFSALTFNAHRIHYDRPYAVGVEHYPGLVVHGPLLATLLLHHACAQAPATPVVSFDFRARAPVFDGEPFDLCAAGPLLWVRTARGVAMTASAAFG